MGLPTLNLRVGSPFFLRGRFRWKLNPILVIPITGFSDPYYR